LRKLKVSMRCRKHKDSINALAFSPSGQLVASGSADRTIILWNAVSGQILRQIDAHSGQVLSLSFAPDGKMIASGSEDCMVKMWPVEGCEGGGVAEEHGAAAPVEQQPPRVRKVSSLHVLSKSDSGLYVSLATDESVVRRCSQCLGYTDGRNTSERCLCWG
jgi:WD40 repeat protein